jgi:ABC-type multidrug transport system fused ATPase/permease subunit
VETTALERLKTDFMKAPVDRRVAAVSSVGTALAFLALLVLLYLFSDLLVWRGLVPSYSQLAPVRQQEFAAEWNNRPEEQRKEAVKRVTASADQARVLVGGEGVSAPTPAEWGLRWRAGVYLALRDRAGEEAADAYLPEGKVGEPAPQLGLLSLVARERNRWTGRLAGWAAGWNGWAWRPGPGGDANVRYLSGLFVLAFGVAAARGVLVNAMMYLSAAATQDLVTRLRRALYLHTYRLGAVALRGGGAAEPVHLFTRQTDAVGAAVQASLTTRYHSPVMVIGLLVIILLVNFWLAVCFLCFAALVWLVVGQAAAYFRREGRAAGRQADSALALLAESLGLLRLVKVFQMERFNQNRVERQLAEAARAGWRRTRGDALSRPLFGAVALLAGVALMYLAGRAVLAGEFTPAGLAVMAVATVSLAPPVAAWFGYRGRLRRGSEAAEAVAEYLARKGEAAEATDAEYLPVLSTRMEFRGVKLEEPGTGRMLLDGVSFAVPAGARVAVVGPDAAEKRALVSLIPRFLDPTAGEVRIEDKNIRWVTHESLRAQVAAVMQDDLVFTDTAANNIGCGDPQFNLPQVIEAAKLAHAHQFIEKLPYGYETVVGGQGHVLKPGERFRLALARALLRDPSILIIEEPTGEIDEDTLALLDDTLERAAAGRTIIFLANRLSTLKNVNRVFLLKDGHVQASGSHHDLWQMNDYYRRLQMVADASAEAAVVKT